MTTYRYSGTWKTTGFIKGNTKWHSGQIVIACDVSGFWRCSLGFSEKKPVSRDILLSGKKGHKIKNVHTKNRLQINLEDGTTIHVGDLHKDQLSEVGTLLMEIQNGKLPDRGFGQKLTPPKASVPCGRQSLVPSQMSPASNLLSVSPRHFTGSVTHSTPMMKDIHSERHENLFALSDT
ncbi:hypothetical protein LSAT2_001526 [Lamellibrachia satsuma]|nr:hypothetical protein LSAT2_001526 [Lamellibrachia satsuma]